VEEDGHGILYGNDFYVLNVFQMADTCNLNLSSSICIDGMCVAPLAPVVITMIGSIFLPLAIMFSIRGLYL